MNIVNNIDDSKLSKVAGGKLKNEDVEDFDNLATEIVNDLNSLNDKQRKDLKSYFTKQAKKKK